MENGFMPKFATAEEEEESLEAMLEEAKKKHKDLAPLYDSLFNKIMNMDIKSLEKFNRESINDNRMIDGIWLPGEKLIYKSRRQQRDAEFIASNWNTKIDSESKSIHISIVPSKVQKKYKRALTVNAVPLRMKDAMGINEWESLSFKTELDRGNALQSHALEMIKLINKVVPSFESKMISDIPLEVRERGDRGWEHAEAKGLTILLYWNLYRVATTFANQKNPESSLNYTDQALSLLPPLRTNEIPRKEEVMMRIYRAHALYDLRQWAKCLKECRLVLTATRLLAFHGIVDMNDAHDILMSKCNGLTHQIMRAKIKHLTKIGASRPYFSHKDRFDMMRELGFGMFSCTRFKCGHCGKTEPEVKLFPCRQCHDLWSCGQDCYNKQWKQGGHKSRCGKLSYRVATLPSHCKERMLCDIKKVGSAMYSDGNNQHVLCRDRKTGDIFDALTDCAITFKEEALPTGEEAIQTVTKMMAQKLANAEIADDKFMNVSSGFPNRKNLN